jgi:hypothetical protein
VAQFDHAVAHARAGIAADIGARDGVLDLVLKQCVERQRKHLRAHANVAQRLGAQPAFVVDRDADEFVRSAKPVQHRPEIFRAAQRGEIAENRIGLSLAAGAIAACISPSCSIL